MSDPLAEAVATLRATKDQLLNQLRRVDDALLALGALNARDQDTSGTPERVTLKAKVLRLMEEQDRTWTAKQIVSVLTAENFPGLSANDPLSAVRTTFTRMQKAGDVVKVDYGVYKAAKWTHDDDPWNLADERLTEEDIRDMVAEERATAEDFARTYDPAEEPF